MPRFSMLVPPTPAMMPSMIFCSKFLSSSSSASWARAAPAVITRPRPKATTARRRARVSTPDEFCTIQPLASVSRIVLFPFKIFRGAHAGLRRGSAQATFSLEGAYQPGSGRFCGGFPPGGGIPQRAYARNKRNVGKVKHVPIDGISPDLDVQQGEIDHRAIGEAVDGVAEGAADDQAERDGGHQGA